MSTTLIVILIAIVLVAFFVIAMSLTLMIKGHHIKSEISENELMRERGIKCAMQEVKESEHNGTSCADLACSGGNCASCGTAEK